MFYEKELKALKRANRFRQRVLYDDNLIDFASNDYLGLSSNKKILKKAYKKIYKNRYNSSKSSAIVNGYSHLHKKFEKYLCRLNNFEDGIILGSGFLANISLIESMVRKTDILFIDEDYHASGILASSIAQGVVVKFKHNNHKELSQKIKLYKNKRVIIAIEGVYSMSGDIASKQFAKIANKHNAILIVDEAHSSGVIGKNLLGWYDYWDIKIKPNHIKMGTFSKAYGSYGAYILGSKHIISYLQNRAKPIIYSTALSLFDTVLAHIGLKYIIKNKKKLSKKISLFQKITKKILGKETKSLIVPIDISNNLKTTKIQKQLKKQNFLVGSIRQPTVKTPILRVILKLDNKKSKLKKLFQNIKISI